MAGRMKEVALPDGRTVNGVIIPFQGGVEHWNEYLLDDGTVIRVKVVTTEIVRVDGQWDKQGNPWYLVETTNVVKVSAAEALRQKG